MSFLKLITNDVLNQAKREIRREVKNETSQIVRTGINTLKEGIRQKYDSSDNIELKEMSQENSNEEPVTPITDSLVVEMKSTLYTGKTVLSGTVNKGSFSVGDTVKIRLTDKTTLTDTIEKIEVFGNDEIKTVDEGKRCGLYLKNVQVNSDKKDYKKAFIYKMKEV